MYSQRPELFPACLQSGMLLTHFHGFLRLREKKKKTFIVKLQTRSGTKHSRVRPSPVERSDVLTDGVRVTVLLRWKVDMGGRPLFMSAAITDGGEKFWTDSKHSFKPHTKYRNVSMWGGERQADQVAVCRLQVAVADRLWLVVTAYAQSSFIALLAEPTHSIPDVRWTAHPLWNGQWCLIARKWIGMSNSCRPSLFGSKASKQSWTNQSADKCLIFGQFFSETSV